MLLTQIGEVEGVDLNVAAAGWSLLVASSVSVLFAILRTYDAVDIVIEAVESSTVHFVSAVGDESVKAIPMFMGMFIILLLISCTKSQPGFGGARRKC